MTGMTLTGGAMFFLAGLAVGGVFLALLWLGVRALGRRNGLAIFAGFALLRAALILTVMIVSAKHHLDFWGIGAGVLGFFTARIISTRWARHQPDRGAAWK